MQYYYYQTLLMIRTVYKRMKSHMLILVKKKKKLLFAELFSCKKEKLYFILKVIIYRKYNLKDIPVFL